MKKSLILTSLLIGVLTLSGCGSDSDDNSGGSSASASGSTGGSSAGSSVNLSWSPLTNNVACDPTAVSYGSATMDAKYWAEGSVTVSCEQYGTYTTGVYGLKSGVDTLTITQLIKEEKSAYSTNVASGTETVTYDYQAGTIHHKISSNVENADCIETYASPLPYTLTSDNIEELLDWEGNGQMLSTTCPNSWYDTSDDGYDGEDNLNLSGSGTIGTNYRLTDSDGHQHLISKEERYTF